MKTYHGIQSEHGPVVLVEENGECRSLNPRHDLRYLSTDGFGWGYSGEQAAQFALALACDVLGDDRKALMFYQRLKFSLIGTLPDEGWVLTEDRVRHALDTIERAKDRVRQ